jgi:RNA recognition motif-containing protein
MKVMLLYGFLFDVCSLLLSNMTDKLKKYFKIYGAVQDAVVMKDPVSKRSRGFGFVTFYDVSSVDYALANEPHTIDSRKVSQFVQMLLKQSFSMIHL